jgi:hypothetical protein
MFRTSFVFLFFVFCAWPAVASPGPAWREATLTVSPSQSSISVSIPEGAKRVAVEVQNAKGNWVRW